MLTVLGYLIFLGGMLALGWLIYQNRLRVLTKDEGTSPPYVLASDREMAQTMPTDILETEIDTREKLKKIKAQQTVTLLGDKERAVQAAATLYEMTQAANNGPWRRTGAESRMLILSGDVFIAKVPAREGGKPTWLKFSEIEAMPLEKFWKEGGVQGGKGPGKLFYENGQSEPVPFNLPHDLTPGINWQVVDIGRFNCEVDGRSENFITGDAYPFVTSREISGERWLLSIESRKGLARGSGGLFVGEPFDPSVEVEALL